jgi:hypothetical protein
MRSIEQQARPPLTNRAMVKEAKVFRKQAAKAERMALIRPGKAALCR